MKFRKKPVVIEATQWFKMATILQYGNATSHTLVSYIH